MIRLAIAIVLAFLAGSVASAATESVSASKSDLFFKASENELILTPSIEYSNESGQVLGNQNKIEDSGRISKLKIDKGITENFSAAFQINYKDAKLTSADDQKLDSEGIQDLHLNLHALRPLEKPSATMHYGAFIRHSVDREKVTRVRANFTGTGVDMTPLSSDAHSAGSSVTPYIGYSEVVGSYVLGARFLQTIWGAKRNKKTVIEGRESLPGPVKAQVPAEVKTTEEGGGATELKVFAERSFDRLTMNVATKFRHLSPKRESDGTTSELVQDELDMLSLEVSPSYKLNSKTDIVGGLGYTKLLNQNVVYQGAKVETGEIISLSIGGRFTF